jgi:hypothetical protein
MLIEPGSAAWIKARLGKWSASRAPALMSTTTKAAYVVHGEILPNQTEAARALGVSVPKLKIAIDDEAQPDVYKTETQEPSADYETLMGEIAFERLCERAATHYVTPAMQRGLDLEHEAAEAYALERMVSLGDSEFVSHPSMQNVCATPDRFVYDDGLVELKCPSDRLKHMGTIAGNKKSVINEYRDQCLWQLFVTGRQWCDLVSYHPDFPPTYQVAIVRVERDLKRFEQFAAAVEAAERYVTELLTSIEARTLGQMEQA